MTTVGKLDFQPGVDHGIADERMPSHRSSLAPTPSFEPGRFRVGITTSTDFAEPDRYQGTGLQGGDVAAHRGCDVGQRDAQGGHRFGMGHGVGSVSGSFGGSFDSDSAS